MAPEESVSSEWKKREVAEGERRDEEEDEDGTAAAAVQVEDDLWGRKERRRCEGHSALVGVLPLLLTAASSSAEEVDKSKMIRMIFTGAAGVAVNPFAFSKDNIFAPNFINPSLKS
eukprot:scaffold3926_cov26-Cyclotella_meneghiniana.AAC.2